MRARSVTVLMGGPDAEHDVSIQSGNAIASALEQVGTFDVQTMVIDIPTRQDIENIQADVIFPALHGPFGEGGPLQQMLEAAGKVFVGSNSSASSIAMNKELTKKIAVGLDIQTPDWCVITQNSSCKVQPPLVLKPIDDGSSIGLAICMTDDEVTRQRTTLFHNRNELLAESYVQGRELTVGIIDGVALPIVEIIPPSDLQTYDFEAKYERDDTQFIISPDLPHHRCVEDAISLYTHMELRDVARVDFILNEEGLWLLEVNTMPGFTSHSLVPMAAESIGITMPQLCSTLVETAASRRIK